MPIDDTFNVPPANQANQTGDSRALVIEEFTGMVEGTIARRSIMQGMIPVRRIQGTDTFTNRAVGESSLQKVVPGVTLDGTNNDFARNALTIDTVIASRHFFGLLEVFLTNIDQRREVALEDGKKIAKFWDQSFMIQAAKAAALTESTFKGTAASGKPAGHFGASQQVLAAAGDYQDPVKLLTALGNLFVKMQKKDVDPRNDDVIVVVRPEEYFTLMQAEQLINTQYLTSAGTSIDAWVLKSWGVPVFESNNAPLLQTVSGHLLSNAGNGNAYDGDFSKLVAQVFAPRALMAGETIPLASDVFYDKLSKTWVVDSHLSFAVGPNRAEYAGGVYLP